MTIDPGEAVEADQLPLSKTSYVLLRMRSEIENGIICRGQPLKQTDLATRYGVSATPVREALRLLQADGLVTYSPHRGATVAAMDLPSVRDTYLLRATMESLATRLSVERQEPGDLERIRALHEALIAARNKVEAPEVSRMNKAFHFAIYSSGSSTISEHIGSLWRLVPETLSLWDRHSAGDTLISQHANILEAMADRDASAAAAFMYEHVLTAGRMREDLRLIAAEG